ncbi:MAG: trigger factor [Syntrophomonadaceae bacterium]|nr:trigger factor [Syntrophomonadaceae bacterium]
MRASVAKIESNRVQLEVQVDAPELEKALVKAYKKLVSKYAIPGFRKGKAPRKILENYIGKGALLSEALEVVIPEAYQNAVAETKIEPIDRPEVELVQAEEGQLVIFKATVAVKPEAELGQYIGLELTAEEPLVSEQDIENHLLGLQKRYARLEEIEDGMVEEGNIAIIDFEGFLDGEPFEGGKGTNYSLEIGSGTFIPGFEAQLVGSRPEEEKDIQVTFPVEYHKEDLAGKDVVFKVKVNNIKRKVISPIDDEFAKDVSEFETLEELRQDIANKLKEAADNKRNNDLRNQAVAKAVENAVVDLPAVMVERRMDSLMHDFKRRLAIKGLDYAKFLEYTNTTEEASRENFRQQAEEATKQDLVLETIAKKEGIFVAEAEVDQELENMAPMYRQSAENLKKMLQEQDGLESIRYGIKLDKTVDFLVAQAVIISQEVARDSGQEMAGSES